MGSSMLLDHSCGSHLFPALVTVAVTCARMHCLHALFCWFTHTTTHSSGRHCGLHPHALLPGFCLFTELFSLTDIFYMPCRLGFTGPRRRTHVVLASPHFAFIRTTHAPTFSHFLTRHWTQPPFATLLVLYGLLDVNAFSRHYHLIGSHYHIRHCYAMPLRFLSYCLHSDILSCLSYAHHVGLCYTPHTPLIPGSCTFARTVVETLVMGPRFFSLSFIFFICGYAFSSLFHCAHTRCTSGLAFGLDVSRCLDSLLIFTLYSFHFGFLPLVLHNFHILSQFLTHIFLPSFPSAVGHLSFALIVSHWFIFFLIHIVLLPATGLYMPWTACIGLPLVLSSAFFPRCFVLHTFWTYFLIRSLDLDGYIPGFFDAYQILPFLICELTVLHKVITLDLCHTRACHTTGCYHVLSLSRLTAPSLHRTSPHTVATTFSLSFVAYTARSLDFFTGFPKFTLVHGTCHSPNRLLWTLYLYVPQVSL